MPARIEHPELVFGLVGRIGADTRAVAELLGLALRDVDYQSHELHLTEQLNEIPTLPSIDRTPVEKRYHDLIDTCNKFRETLSNFENIDSKDAMSTLAIFMIRAIRGKLSKSVTTPAEKCAFIINQIKRPEEVEPLKNVYGDRFILVSCHSSRDKRRDVLTTRMSKDHPDHPNPIQWRSEAEALIERDDNEEDTDWGQRVRDVFPMADVIIDAGSEATIKAQIQRFVWLLFGDNTITPTVDEHASYLAHVSALRSSDLSRQVGAVIADNRGEVIASGCNEAPSPGGGLYWEGDPEDGRDFAMGEDPNQRRKRQMVMEIVSKLKDNGYFVKKYKEANIAELENILLDDKNGILKESSVLDISEFGRSVHAEMAAITEAARMGYKTAGATLYCNTFPCHNCAKHIVSSGIKRVVYLKPYPKSGVFELYPDSIDVDPVSCVDNKVQFKQFFGIVSARYDALFSKRRWKDKLGRPIIWKKEKASPKVDLFDNSYIDFEIEQAHRLQTFIEHHSQGSIQKS